MLTNLEFIGSYGHRLKWSAAKAICGEPGTQQVPSRRYMKVWADGGTTEDRFVDFIREIVDDLPHGDEGRRFCFTMDNLNAHHGARVKAAIYSRGHRLVFRAPYYPVDGPIEYVFNTLQQELNQRMHYIKDGTDLRHELFGATQRIYNYQPYFRNCGMWK